METLGKIAERKGICSSRRHIFLCLGDKCCDLEKGQEVWDYLKTRCKELGLVNDTVMRTKAGCLRVCSQGPIAVVYPEGIWFHDVDLEFCEKLVTSYLRDGIAPEQNRFAVNPLYDPKS